MAEDLVIPAKNGILGGTLSEFWAADPRVKGRILGNAGTSHPLGNAGTSHPFVSS